MTRKILKHKCFAVTAVLLSFLIFALPILAQMDDMMAGRMAGEQAARSNVNGTLWFAAGCLIGVIGVLIAYVYEPNPPSMMLMGKSPEYVMAFTDAYKTTGKSIQTRQAWTGCLTAVVVSTLLQLALYSSY